MWWDVLFCGGNKYATNIISLAIYEKKKCINTCIYIPLDDGIYMSVLELLKNARSIYWEMSEAYIRNLDKIFYHLENIWFCILLDI